MTGPYKHKIERYDMPITHEDIDNACDEMSTNGWEVVAIMPTLPVLVVIMFRKPVAQIEREREAAELDKVF